VISSEDNGSLVANQMGITRLWGNLKCLATNLFFVKYKLVSIQHQASSLIFAKLEGARKERLRSFKLPLCFVLSTSINNHSFATSSFEFSSKLIAVFSWNIKH
jgi:hypothetical protein